MPTPFGVRLVLAATPPLLMASLAACQQQANTLSEDEQKQGWQLMFDGKTTDGWRGFRKDSISSGWRVVDGALTRVAVGGDLASADEFANFEFQADWKVAPNGNSGIMYRVSEAEAHPYETGPEFQVLDDAGHADGRSRLTAAGSDFGIYPAPAGVVKAGGEWNHARIVVSGNHVEHWLNGVKLLEYELGSPDWETRVQGSKFKQWPSYGRASKGHIVLQDHGDQVAYRNIKIRILP